MQTGNETKRRWGPQYLCGLLASVSLVAMATAASAQSAIGSASVVQNDVTGSGKGKLGVGDNVFQNEIIKTGAASLARLGFVDNTNVSVGASSQLALDKFVYSGGGTAKSVVFNAARGSFRFVSGSSPSDAYKVLTPEAAIGVRGTTYDVQVGGGRTTVVLISGAASVCLRAGAPNRCVELRQPCESVTLTNAALGGKVGGNVQKWSFDNSCNGGRDFWRPDAPLGNNPPQSPPSPPSPPSSPSY